AIRKVSGLCRRQKNRHIYFYNLLLKIELYEKSGKLINSKKLCDIGLTKLTKDDSPILKGNFLNHIGTYYFLSENLDHALAYYQKSLDIYRDVKNIRQQGRAYFTIASVQYQNGDFINAENSMLKSLTLFEDINDIEGIALTLGNLGSLYIEDLKFEKAYEALTRCESLFRSMNNIAGLITVMANLGFIQMSSGCYRRAISYYQEAEKLSLNSNDVRFTVSTQLELAQVYTAIGHLAKAETTIISALKKLENSNTAFNLADLLNFQDYIQLMQCNLSNISSTDLMFSSNSKVQSGGLMPNKNINQLLLRLILGNFADLKDLESKFPHVNCLGDLYFIETYLSGLTKNESLVLKCLEHIENQSGWDKSAYDAIHTIIISYMNQKPLSDLLVIPENPCDGWPFDVFLFSHFWAGVLVNESPVTRKHLASYVSFAEREGIRFRLVNALRKLAEVEKEAGEKDTSNLSFSRADEVALWIWEHAGVFKRQIEQSIPYRKYNS
ncbi:tetratricopeptide repeat protein, partial [bacterium]|nr:tetratricopeptide repeat protein [candidate division CSSED10-310 bacterium]